VYDSEHVIELVVFYALLAAISWGIGDFLGGFTTKTSHVSITVFVGHSIGLLMLIPFYFILNEPNLNRSEIVFSAIAGLSGVMGLYMLYVGLSKGKMGYVAPISAVTAMTIPVMVGFAEHGFLELSKYVGIILAIVSIWGLTKGEVGTLSKNDLFYAIMSGLGIGFFLVFISYGGKDATFSPMIVARIASVALFSLIVIYRKNKKRDFGHFGKRQSILICSSGFFDMTANLLFIKATQFGALEIASVLSSLYPTTTIILSWVILKDKIEPSKFVYLIAILISIILLA